MTDSRKNRESRDDEESISITTYNLADQVDELIQDDENIKKSVRKCIFLSFNFYSVLAYISVGLVIGAFFGHNYHPLETTMQTIESRFHLVPKDT